MTGAMQSPGTGANMSNSKLRSLIDHTPAETAGSVHISENSRWSHPVPFGYTLNKSGVCKNPTKEGAAPVRISGPICVVAHARGADGECHTHVVEFEDRDGNLKRKLIPLKRLFGNAQELIQELASSGLFIEIAHTNELLRYLNGFVPATKSLSVSKCGWLTNASEPDGLCYAFANGGTESSNLPYQVYLDSDEMRDSRSCGSRGTLKDWQEKVASLCADDDMSILVAGVALSGPLLLSAGMDSGGVHLWGESSKGKTTRLQFAASFFGCGADPSERPELSYIKRWNTTHNAIEVLAAISNDSALCLDEIGTCNARDFGKLIYDLFGGQGKQSMNANRNLKQVRTWRTSVISTGEISSRQKIENGNEKAKAGQLLRLIDIELKGDE
jgi:putative DNA primase/helicase